MDSLLGWDETEVNICRKEYFKDLYGINCDISRSRIGTNSMKASVQEKVMKKKVVRKLKNAKAADVGDVTREMLVVLNVCTVLLWSKLWNTKQIWKKKSKTMTPIKILIKNSHFTMDSI